MKRMAAGLTALAFTGLGTIGLAGPTGAQESGPVVWDYSELDWEGGVELLELDGTLSPQVVEPGDEVTVTGDCNDLSNPEHPHELRWALLREGAFPGWEGLAGGDHVLEFDSVLHGTMDMPFDEDGFEWSVSFNAPALEGDFRFAAICVPQEPGDFPFCDIGAFHRGLTLEIEPPPPSTTTTAPPTTTTAPPTPPTPEAPPAVPVPAVPQLTG